jgi:hypothetical protein
MRYVLLLTALAASAQTRPEEIRMNQVQFLASHNSYKQAIDPSLRTILRESMGDRLKGLEYNHLPLAEQLDRGLRGLEIDVLHDPEGGRYARPAGLTWVKERGLPAGAPYDPEGLMQRPGLKVLHVQDMDFRTHAYTFRQALGQLRAWSEKHPRHLPIVITMNAKQDAIDRPGFTKPLPFDRAAYDAWDAEIQAGLPAGKLITPRAVQAGYPTLQAAVRAHAWPTVEASRGKFLFVLDEGEAQWRLYLDGRRNRVMFVNVPEDHPEAAVRIVNEPQKNVGYIQHLVRSGYLVRTRSDADTREARTNDKSRFAAALQSGAQIISTDYYVPDPELGNGFEIRLAPGWNPLLLPAFRPLPPIE